MVAICFSFFTKSFFPSIFIPFSFHFTKMLRPYSAAPYPGIWFNNASRDGQPRRKSISIAGILFFLGLLAWGIVALVLDSDAHGNRECGSIYELCIFGCVLHALTITIIILEKCNLEDKSLDALVMTGYMALAIWTFIIHFQKLSHDCRERYESVFQTVFYFYFVHFLLCFAYVIVLGIIVLFWFIMGIYSCVKDTYNNMRYQ